MPVSNRLMSILLLFSLCAFTVACTETTEDGEQNSQESNGQEVNSGSLFDNFYMVNACPESYDSGETLYILADSDAPRGCVLMTLSRTEEQRAGLEIDAASGYSVTEAVVGSTHCHEIISNGGGVDLISGSGSIGFTADATDIPAGASVDVEFTLPDDEAVPYSDFGRVKVLELNIFVSGAC